MEPLGAISHTLCVFDGILISIVYLISYANHCEMETNKLN